MCRWFAYISDSEPCLLDDVLIKPAHSLTKQVHSSFLPKLFHHNDSEEADNAERKEITAHNKFVNSDGTGIAFYTTTQAEFGTTNGPRPQLYRTIQPPLNDPNFLSICTHTASLTIFGHIRMATSAVHAYNNHPFVFGRHAFMHNGAITSFSSIRRGMITRMSHKAFENVMGSTDSEHLAGLYFTFLGDDWEKEYELDEMKKALEKAVQVVIDLLVELPTKDGKVLAPSSLNLCTTDGERLLAFRFRNSTTEQPPSLYVSTTAGVTLNRKYPGYPEAVSADSDIKPEANGHVPLGGSHSHPGPGGAHDTPHKALNATSAQKPEGDKPAEAHGKHVIVASEPSTFDRNEWDLVGKNEAVLVDKDMSVRREKIIVDF